MFHIDLLYFENCRCVCVALLKGNAIEEVLDHCINFDFIFLCEKLFVTEAANNDGPVLFPYYNMLVM